MVPCVVPATLTMLRLLRPACRRDAFTLNMLEIPQGEGSGGHQLGQLLSVSTHRSLLPGLLAASVPCPAAPRVLSAPGQLHAAFASCRVCVGQGGPHRDQLPRHSGGLRCAGELAAATPACPCRPCCRPCCLCRLYRLMHRQPLCRLGGLERHTAADPPCVRCPAAGGADGRRRAAR